MRGHIRKHGKGWVAVIDEGHQPARGCSAGCKGVRIWVSDDPKAETCPKCRQGLGEPVEKRRQRWYSFATEGEAEVGLTALLGKLDNDEYEPPSKDITVAEYITDIRFPHLADRIAIENAGGSGGLKETTVAQYKTLAGAHIVPRIGSVPLRKLTALRLDRLYSDLLTAGRIVRPGKPPAPLSPTTVHAVHVTISALLTYAVKKGIISKNAAQLADPPGPRRKEQATWDAAQTTKFLEATKNDRLAPLYLLALSSGLRRSELCGLSWSQVDLEAGTLTVSKGRVVVGYKVVETRTKTAKSRRTIAIAPAVVDALKTLRTRQGAERGGMAPERSGVDGHGPPIRQGGRHAVSPANRHYDIPTSRQEGRSASRGAARRSAPWPCHRWAARSESTS